MAHRASSEQQALTHSRRHALKHMGLLAMGSFLKPAFAIASIDPLVDNAIKYSEKGSEITISTSNEGKDYIKVAVEDNGEGISAEDQDQIFSRFFRTASARATDNQGSGLGLAIVKHLVNNLNGEVGLESKPEKGSIFWFTVPISQ